MNTPACFVSRHRMRFAFFERPVSLVLALSAFVVPTLSWAQTPTFNALLQTPVAVGSGFPDDATVGDINGDGKLDAIMPGTNGLRVLLGNGNGTFVDQVLGLADVTSSNVVNLPANLAGFLPRPVGGAGGLSGGIKAVDVNRDGKLDLVCVTTVGINFVNYSFVSVMINTGNDANGVPVFTTTHHWIPFLGVRPVTVGDVNGDNWPDFIVGNSGGEIQVWTNNNGTGTFTPGQITFLTPGGGSTGQGVIADLDGDGRADYVVASGLGAHIFFGNGDGTFQTPNTYLPNNAVSVAVVDVNNDGRPDLLIGDQGSGLLVYLNNGGRAFSAPSAYAIPGFATGFSGGCSVVVADMNGDGKLDAVLSNTNSNSIAILLGDGNGGFGAPGTYAASVFPTFLFVGDFNGDGKPDIGVDLRNSRAFGVLTNTTVPSFPTPAVSVSAPVISVPAAITTNATSSAGAMVNFTATATSAVSMELFRRDTVTAEPWKSYTTTFTSARTGNFTLGFNIVTAAGAPADNSIFIDAVKLTNGASTLFADGFETPALANSTTVSTNGGGPATLGSNWFFTNYAGITRGPSAPNWGSIANQVPPEGGQHAYLQAVASTKGKMQTTSQISLVAGQVYTLTFQQASREIFGGTLTYTVTLDNVESVPVIATPASGSTFAIGTTSVNLSATNSAGVTATASFNVTVKGTPPVISAASPITVEATSPAGGSVAVLGTAVDSHGVSLPVTASPSGPYAIGITAVTLSATDAAGLTSTKQVVVNVVDTTPPAISGVPANITAEATSAAGAVVTFAGASANDLVDGSVAVVATPGSGSTFALGTSTVKLKATDSRSNTSSASFTVTVQDTTAPVIASMPDLIVEATSAAGAVVNYAAASATDAVGVTSLTYSQASGSTFGLGTTTVTVTASDFAGNSSSKSFTVLVHDTTAPTITSLSTNAPTLWPPNHKMVAVTVSGAASDLVSATSLKIVSATSSEPDNGLGDGDTAGDIQITGAMTLNLRAERGGNGIGRTYTIVVEAKDATGNATTKPVTVFVPLNQGGK